ncbi:hypothetical protein BDR03DRAFT_957602, partial [Suillus americanus]
IHFTPAIVVLAVVGAKLAPSASATPQIDPTKKCPTWCYTQSACKKCTNPACVSISSFSGFDDMTHLRGTCITAWAMIKSTN